MKTLIATTLLALSTSAFAWGDWQTLTNTNSFKHPSSMFHTVCVYTGGVQIVVSGFCPIIIQYNLVTGQWKN